MGVEPAAWRPLGLPLHYPCWLQESSRVWSCVGGIDPLFMSVDVAFVIKDELLLETERRSAKA